MLIMRKYELWNRIDKINGINPSEYLDYPPFKDYDGDIILIYNEDETRISQVESKEVLSQVYDIDIDLGLDEFMAQYFEKVNNQEKDIEE